MNWHSRAQGLAFPTHGIVDGMPCFAEGGATIACVNPATGDRLADVSAFDSADIDHAVGSARTAFRSTWRWISPAERKSALLRLAALVEDSADELALLDSMSMGKPAQVARDSDVPSAAAFFRWYAEAIDKLYGETVPSDFNSVVTAVREPCGIVAVITPWNYPLEEAAIKLAPALAAGNCVILKPPEIAPFSAIRLGELALQAGIPPGVLNVAPGIGKIAGRALGLHPDVDCVGFTGSTSVGKQLLQYSGRSNLKRVSLECGGKSATIIFDDVEDLEFAASEAARSVFRNQGEVCSAGSRVLVQHPIYGSFRDALLRLAIEFEPGDPLDSESPMGAVASGEHYGRITTYIERGLAEGANLICDGRRAGTAGLFIGPTIFEGVTNRMTIAQEEIFGPVLCLIPFEREEDAVSLANDSAYGLVGSVWTADLGRALRVAKRLEVGSVTINGIDAQSEAAPFGGYKQSGIGREHSLHAFDNYTQLKTTWIRH